ncbi:MAG: branched-chain amino acid ABC transporter permease [Sterolibacterium sp.]|jgi:branched-chain amino acid transport system permease protein
MPVGSDNPTTPANVVDSTAALPRVRIDYQPLLILPVLALLVLPLVGSFPTWVTLTVAGLAMGMMIFIMASGLTLIFGLMDVLNFGHGAFVSVGAFTATLVLLPMKDWVQADSVLLNLAALGLAILLAMLVTGLLGWAFERIIIRPVYGLHLKQILITMGGMIVAEQMINVIWGAEQIPLPLPETFRGAFVFGDSAVEKYRLIAVGIGLAVFVAMFLVLNRTKIGLLIRAGVENSEMVEALGYRIRRLFVGVFVAGSALAGLGGVLWGLYKETLTAAIGGEITVLVFIVIIIGGLGSVGGCFIGALLVALVANYAGFLVPKVALVSDILLMVAVLLWRPRGLYPVAKR